MKNFILLILVAGVCFGASAQNKKRPARQKKSPADTLISTHASGVPDKLIEKFRKEYPEAIEMTWSKEGNDVYKVVFKDPPNTQQLIEYDKDWKVIRKETELEMKQVPDSILQYYKQHYPGETRYKVWLREDINGKTYYSNGTEFGLFFDLNGKVIRREPYK
jgi:hypothetical protein